MTRKTPQPPPPQLTGFCNPSWWPLTRPDYLASHRRCPSDTCPCPCHTEHGVRPASEQAEKPATPQVKGDVRLDHLTLSQAVDLLYAAAEKLNEVAVYDTVRREDVKGSLLLIARIRAAVGKARDADDALVKNAYAKGRGDHVVDGIGPVKVTRSDERRSWDERGIAQAVLDVHLTGSDGEVPEPWTVVSWLLDVVHVDYARIGALRSLGLDPGDFSTWSKGRPVVRLPGQRW